MARGQPMPLADTVSPRRRLHRSADETTYILWLRALPGLFFCLSSADGSFHTLSPVHPSIGNMAVGAGAAACPSTVNGQTFP